MSVVTTRRRKIKSAAITILRYLFTETFIFYLALLYFHIVSTYVADRFIVNALFLAPVLGVTYFFLFCQNDDDTTNTGA